MTSVLFAQSPTARRTLVSKPGLGYLAFQDGFPPALVSTLGSKSPRPALQQPLPPPQQQQPQKKPSLHQKQKTHASTASRSRELEQAEAERGEEEWVSRGGVLRDRYGRVDDARTKRVRAEVDRKAREERLQMRWEAYEERWRALGERCRGTGHADAPAGVPEKIGFGQVPWPVCVCGENGQENGNQPKLTMTIALQLDPALREARPLHRCRQTVVLEDLTLDRIREFLLSPLDVRGCCVTPKARIRSSFLRWHPDKLGWLLDRVKEGEVDEVNAGIAIVIDCLQQMHGVSRAY